MIPDGAALRFGTPLVLALLVLLPPLIWWQVRRARRPHLLFSDLRLVGGVAPGWRARLAGLPLVLKVAAAALLVVAAARPMAENRFEETLTEGIDIVLAVDHSGSMAAVDLGRKGDTIDPVSRLDFAKRVVGEFIGGRMADRIGLVVFAGRAFTRCPLTLDYGLLEEILSSIEITSRYDGTAIGMGLATAVNRLRDSEAETRVVILLTDGRNNTGEIDPVTAARLARSMNVKVYTVGVGTEGVAPVPVQDPVYGPRYVFQPVDLDEKTLKRIADETEGRYFRATDARTLEEIFQRIDALEKTEVKVRERVRRTELFRPVALAGGGLFLLQWLLAGTVLRTEP